tara:strand:+ start:78 stop:338 length:261 start_codon:yes stop_codon:yes gene_type:complete
VTSIIPIELDLNNTHVITKINIKNYMKGIYKMTNTNSNKFKEINEFLTNPKNSNDRCKYWNELSDNEKLKTIDSIVEFFKGVKINK